MRIIPSASRTCSPQSRSRDEGADRPGDARPQDAGGVGLATSWGVAGRGVDPDPTILPPGGALVKSGRAGYAVGRSALSVGGAAALATGVQESGLQASQELRTPGESLASIGGAAILGGLLGAGASRIMNAAEAKQAAKVMDAARRDGFDAETDALHKELIEGFSPQSAGAAAAPRDTLDDLSIAGTAASKVAKATAQLNPLLRTLQSPSQAVRSVASQLMENPVSH